MAFLLYRDTVKNTIGNFAVEPASHFLLGNLKAVPSISTEFGCIAPGVLKCFLPGCVH